MNESIAVRKLNNVLKIRTDQPAFFQSLDNLASFYGSEDILLSSSSSVACSSSAPSRTLSQRKEPEVADADRVTTTSKWELERARFGATDLNDSEKKLSALLTGKKSGLSQRRRLRSAIEHRQLEGHRQFLQSFGRVHSVLDQVQHSVQAMRLSCDHMSERLETTRTQAGKIIAQARELQSERERNQLHQEAADAFLCKFQLSAEEREALTSGSIECVEFFHALARVRQISVDSKVLLRNQHQRADLSLSIMDQMSELEQTAFERIYRWTKSQCIAFQHVSPEIHPMFRTAVRTLAEREMLLTYCLTEIQSIRSKVVHRCFIEALQRGGPRGTPRPIELHAHDPLRYTGDMLAWLHQAVAGESEILRSLLITPLRPRTPNDSRSCNAEREQQQQQQANSDTVALSTSTLPHTTQADAEKLLSHVKRVLGHVFETAGRPFRFRFEQVLSSQPGAVVVYKLANLLEFYAHTIGELMDSEAALTRTFAECRAAAMEAFFVMIRQQSDAHLVSPPLVTADLGPPQALNSALGRLAVVLTTFEGSLVPAEQRESAFTPVLAACVDPLLQMCTLSAAGLEPGEMAVFLINCLAALRACLQPYQFASARCEILSAQVHAHMNTLVQTEALDLVTRCGLATVLRIFQDYHVRRTKDDGVTPPMSTVPGLEASTIAGTMRAFEASLLEMGTLQTPLCQKLLLPEVRQEAHSRVAATFIAAYTNLHTAVSDAENAYPTPQSLLRLSPDQVKTLIL
mmetsp:Transcript_17959/g.53962  ORF Transcript_17959/g.53962 Transcript_17959/m.53962 type:complete len:745 (+) Transcript_17959:96-2330(+)